MTILDSKRRDEAAAWFSAQHRGLMSSDERSQLDTWQADPDNRAALGSMHELWGELEGLKGLESLKGMQDPEVRPLPRRAVWAFPLAACLALALGGALWLSEGRLLTRTTRTFIGEQSVTTLPDGTVADLSVMTNVDYRMSARRRDVELRDGEALFFVHKDASRPFVVRVGDYEVRDVGTAFDVRHRDDDLQVSVLEGMVRVRAVAGPNAGQELAQLTPGRQLSLVRNPGGASWTAMVRSVPVQTMAEWRLRTVTYEDVPIAQVVEDLNRYFPRPLEVADPAVAARRVTMRLQLADRERTLETLSALLGAKIHHGSDADIITSGP